MVFSCTGEVGGRYQQCRIVAVWEEGNKKDVDGKKREGKNTFETG